MWELFFYVGLPLLAWQVQLFRSDWSKSRRRETRFGRLTPWKLGWLTRLLTLPFGASSKLPMVSETAKLEQRLVHYEADRLIRDHRQHRRFGLRK
ncbi:MAG: hypothetical protein AAGK23_09100 [Pseudomonadota bacterium]